MSHTKLNRRTVIFMLLCSAVYFTSYLTRYNFSAVIEAVSAETGTLRESLGLVSTAAFFTYGIGQLISGFIGDRVHPRLLLTVGMTVTALCNILMPLMPSSNAMVALWGVNGFAQALFWPPLVRIMVDNLSEENYNRACIWVSTGAQAATILVYLLAALCSALWSWKTLFYICAGAAVLMTVIWLILAPKKQTAKSEKLPEAEPASAPQKNRIGVFAVLIMVPIALAIVLQGLLRDGVSQWLPSLIADSSGLSASSAILSGVVLPIFTIICYNLSSMLEDKIKNELITSFVFFACAAVCSGILILLLGTSPIISVILLGIITGCMHGVNLMLISRVPKYFAKYGKISTVSGVVNAFTYVGSALSAYFVAVISGAKGWTFTIAVWLVIAALGAAICILTVKPWNKFRRG